MKRRRRTRTVYAGNVAIGGKSPVSIQSMTKCPTKGVGETAKQVNRLAKLGCEIVRVAVKDQDDAAAISGIKERVKLPLVADIHFDWRLAMAAIENGADKVRLNPGNITERSRVREVCSAARRKGIPIRVGLNSGSIRGNGGQVRSMLAAAKEYIRLMEGFRFRDLVISLKCQNVPDTVTAYRAVSEWCDYPLHIGLTATGPASAGLVKSSAALGSLLLDGIGDTVRISLTASPEEEVSAAKCLLQSLGLRAFGPEVISCPTCGRCSVDLVRIVNELERRLSTEKVSARAKGAQVAVMGCEVNGPGEARQAAAGVAFGAGSGLLFKKGKPVRKVAAKDCVETLIREIRKM